MIVGVAEVTMPESYTFVPSARTWKMTEPLGPTSASIPMSELNEAHIPASVYLRSDAAWTPRPLAYTVPWTVIGRPSPASCSPLLRSISAGPQPLVIDVQPMSETQVEARAAYVAL